MYVGASRKKTRPHPNPVVYIYFIFYFKVKIFYCKEKPDEIMTCFISFRATRENKYLYMAESMYKRYLLSSSWAFSWDDKTAAVHVLLYGLTKKASYGQAFQRYLSNWLPGKTTTPTAVEINE